ncbi:MAG: FAD-dependent oxidoreductase, partial [Candidatus Xenobia bacterium]
MSGATQARQALQGDFKLGIGDFHYSDLYRPERLAALADAFYTWLNQRDPALGERFTAYRKGEALARTVESDLLVAVAPHQSAFIARLFDIESAREQSLSAHDVLAPIYRYKKELVMKRAMKKYATPPDRAPDVLGLLAKARPDLVELSKSDPELALAQMACEFLDLENGYAKGTASDDTRVRELEKALGVSGAEPKEFVAAQLLDPLDRFSSWAMHRREHGDHKFESWISLKMPEDLHWPDGLVKVKHPDPAQPNRMETPDGTERLRYGFKLTDPRWNLRETLDHTHYCMICHEREKDSCSRGLPMPRKDKPVQKNPLGVTLNGCPLDERISEMHVLKRQGDTIASLSMVMIDNPMCPTTGHRICNDCMKACIFQKQEPVNIPQIETRALSDVLNLPWGVEIYGLLTRWNPLNVNRPYTLAYNGRNVLVVGLGPAGFALSEYLMNEGFGIVAIDGLKIEPLPADLVGGEGRLPKAIRNFSELQDELDERISYGFGGVAEYGITIRWDKNFLKLIYMTLMRRTTFRVYGGIRFGGTITAEDAWELGFDHVAIAAGAGKPSIVEMQNNLIPGVRKASDFLMALQLSGGYKKYATANLQLRLPVIVIGGGLTGVDTATESLAYYPVQVEKMLDRYEAVVGEFGEDYVWGRLNAEEKGILTEMLEHGRQIRAERQAAAKAGRPADVISL